MNVIDLTWKRFASRGSPFSTSINAFQWVCRLPCFRYDVSLAFENHLHVRKRTYPIFQNEIMPEGADIGTVYLGDGAMGAQDREKGKPNYCASYGREKYTVRAVGHH